MHALETPSSMHSKEPYVPTQKKPMHTPYTPSNCPIYTFTLSLLEGVALLKVYVGLRALCTLIKS